MKMSILATLLGTMSLALPGTLLVSAQPARALPVFDATNYAQNLLIAARTLQQINQQVQQLQNEAQMLTNMARNLSRIDFPQLEELRAKLQEIDRLMGQASNLGFRVDGLEAQLERLFPADINRAISADQRVTQARARVDSAMSQFRQTIGVQSRIVENVRSDAETLSRIVERSQGAEGALQAQQATNQLLALAAQQQFQLQTLMAAQFRGETIDQARRAQSEQEGRVQTRRFLGDGSAYTPR